MGADIATGITIGFGTTGFSAEILDTTPPPLTRGAVDNTHQGTVGARTKMPTDLYEVGACEFDIHFEPGTNPPINEPEEPITITFPNDTTWKFNGFMSNYEPTAPLEDKMTARVEITPTGKLTIDPLGGAGGGSFAV